MSAGTLRPPLNYEHPQHARHPETACQHPEGNLDSPAIRFYPSRCTGCRAAAFARVVASPNTIVMTSDGPMRHIDVLRRQIDPNDPMRVLFERALAERGVA